MEMLSYFSKKRHDVAFSAPHVEFARLREQDDAGHPSYAWLRRVLRDLPAANCHEFNPPRSMKNTVIARP